MQKHTNKPQKTSGFKLHIHMSTEPVNYVVCVCVCVFGHLVSFRTNNVTVTGYSSFTPRLRVGGKDKQRQKNSNKGKKKTYKKR